MCKFKCSLDNCKYWRWCSGSPAKSISVQCDTMSLSFWWDAYSISLICCHPPMSLGATNWELSVLLNQPSALAKHKKPVWQLPPRRQTVNTPPIPVLLTVIKPCAVIMDVTKTLIFTGLPRKQIHILGTRSQQGAPRSPLCLQSAALLLTRLEPNLSSKALITAFKKHSLFAGFFTMLTGVLGRADILELKDQLEPAFLFLSLLSPFFLFNCWLHAEADTWPGPACACGSPQCCCFALFVSEWLWDSVLIVFLYPKTLTQPSSSVPFRLSQTLIQGSYWGLF